MKLEIKDDGYDLVEKYKTEKGSKNFVSQNNKFRHKIY